MKPEDDARQRRHDLDHRLHVRLHAGMHELADVEGAEQGERHGEQQRVERPLQRPEDQRGEAELGLEVVGAAGGLPDVLGPGVATA